MSNAVDFLNHWLQSGNAILVVIAVLVAEAVALCVILKGKAGPIVAGLLPGLCLVLALRAALTGGGPEWVGFWLTASLPAHIADLRNRLKAARGP